jgi:NAD(P)-dependent dehydrogenase (short-subunit alcohol dehydrogenase family)
MNDSFLQLEGKVALVTGAGTGLGAAIALAFAQAGAAVGVHYQQSQAGAEATLAQVGSEHGLLLQADLTQPDAVQAIIAQTVQAFGRLDILVNNAGIYPQHSLLEMPLAAWERVLASNLTSTMLCTQAAAQQMIAQGGGALVNIASIEAQHPAPGHSHYNAAKAGIVMLTRSAAFELGPHAIRVNCVAPGLIWRKGLEQDWPDGVGRYQAAAALGRLGQPQEVANACLFLASPAASWITGTTLTVDGGVTVRSIF